MPDFDVDVIIVRAAPTGLMLASELCLSRVRPLVVERLASVWEIPKAGGLGGQILDLLRYRGVLERFEAASGRPRPAPRFPFGGLHVDFTRLPDSPVQAVSLPQPQLERLLGELATERGAEIRRGHEVIGLNQDDATVNVDVRGPNGPYRVTAQFVVGTFTPDLELRTERGATSVAELLPAARPVLLDLADSRALRDAAYGWSDRVDVVSATCQRRPADAMLIRPDAHVAWAAAIDEPDDAAMAGLRRALIHWFGAPA